MIEFDWPVLQNYSWVDYYPVVDGLVVSPTPTRTLLLDTAGRIPPRKIHPLIEQPELFAEFAQLQPTEEAILRFARRYGALSGASQFVISPTKSSRILRGDSIDLWTDNIMAMNRAYHLWTLAFSTPPDLRRLQNYIHWSGVAVRYESPNKEYSEIIAHRIESPAVFKCFPPADLVEPAKFFVAKLINSRIDGLVSPVLRLRADAMEARFRPLNLLGALWYQFFSALLSGAPVRLKPCEKCGYPIRVKRSTKRICEKCSKQGRDEAYRKTKKGVKENGH